MPSSCAAPLASRPMRMMWCSSAACWRSRASALSLARRFWFKPDENPVAPKFDRKELLARILVTAGRLARERIEIPPVPRATYPAFAVDAFLDRAFAERAALMRAMVAPGDQLATDAEHADLVCSGGDHLAPAVDDLVRLGDVDFLHRHAPDCCCASP